MNWAQCIDYFSRNAGLKTQNFTKNTLALLPPRNIAVFESQFLFEYYTQRTKKFTTGELLSFTSSLNVCSQFVSNLHKITHAGTQVTQWDFQNKATRASPPWPAFVLEVSLCNLRICDFVPCDRIVQRAYLTRCRDCCFKGRIYEVESPFLEPQRETKTGSRNREVEMSR